MKKKEIFNYFFILLIVLSTVLIIPNKSDIFELPRYHIFSFLVFLFLFFKLEKKYILPEEFNSVHILFMYLITYSILYFIFKPSILIFSHIIFMLSLWISFNIFKNFEEKYQKYFLILISIIGFLEAIYGIFQYLNLDPIFKTAISTEDKRMQMAGSIGIPAIFGIFLGISLLIQFYLFLQKKNKLYLIIIFITLISFFIDNTRSAIFGFFLGFLFLFKNHKAKIVLIFLFLIIFFSLLIIKKDLRSRWSEILDFKKIHSGTIRLLYWKVSFEAIKEKPFLGYGPLSFSKIYFEKQAELIGSNNIKPPEVIQPLLRAHNDFLQLWLEYGILGIFLYILIIIKEILSKNNEPKKAILVLFAFASIFLFPTFFPSTLILMVLILGLKF